MPSLEQKYKAIPFIKPTRLEYWFYRRGVQKGTINPGRYTPRTWLCGFWFLAHSIRLIVATAQHHIDGHELELDNSRLQAFPTGSTLWRFWGLPTKEGVDAF